jgi:hypothetical protein
MTQDCRFGNALEPRWSCPAAAYSAGAAYVLPCSPIGTTGSDWTHEKVPQKPNQNALRVSPSKIACPAGTSWRRRCSRGTIVTADFPFFPFQHLDAGPERTVHDPTHIRTNGTGIMPYQIRLTNPGDYPTFISRSGEDKIRPVSNHEHPRSNMMQKMTDCCPKLLSGNCPQGGQSSQYTESPSWSTIFLPIFAWQVPRIEPLLVLVTYVLSRL